MTCGAGLVVVSQLGIANNLGFSGFDDEGVELDRTV
jgi:predicted Zn-dependent protease